jgi:hypothetical protein
MLVARARIAEERRKLRERLEADALPKIELPRRNLAPALPVVAPQSIDLDPGLPRRLNHAQRINEQIAQQQQINAQTEQQMRQSAQSLMGAASATVAHELPQRGAGKDLRIPSVEGKAVPARRPIVVDPAGPAIVYPTRNVRSATGPDGDASDLPNYSPARLAGPSTSVAQVQELPTRRPRVDGASPPSTVGESDPFLPTRPRRAFPKGTVEFQEQLLRDREVMPPENMSRKKAALFGFLRGLSSGDLLTGGVGAAVGALVPGATSRLAQRDKISDASGQLDTALEREGRRSEIDTKRAAAATRRNAPAEAEKDNLRQLYNSQPYFDPDKNPEHRALRDRAAALGMILPKRDEKDNNQLEYNDSGELLLVPRNGGPARPVLDESGQPVKRRATRSNLQLGQRLAPDGITVIQTQYDPDSGQFVDSVGRDGKPIVKGQVGKIDPTTGAPVSTVITNTRITQQQGRENETKRKTYESEAAEWVGKEKTFRANKEAEDRALGAKQNRLAALYAEKPAGYFGSGRTAEEIKIDIARVTKDLQTHRANSTRFQNDADKAAERATAARRNAGLQGDSGASQSVIGRAPARDGKHHYTPSEIRAQAEAAGVSYESLYNKLKANTKVVIDQ